MSAEIGSDELWLEVICQANLEIAGSPRNIFRYSGLIVSGGRALDGFGGSNAIGPLKLRIPVTRKST
jgi:hypothetical protein